MRRSWRAASLAGPALGVLLAGCAYSSENIVRRTTPAAIEETLEALNDPKNQGLIRDLVGDAEVQDAVAEIAEAMTGGLLEGLTDEARAARLSELSERLVSRLIAAASEGIREELTPSVRSMVERTVAGAIGRALSPKTRRDAQALAAGIAREGAAAMVTGASEAIRSDLGPALAAVVDDDLGPALERALADRLVPALSRSIEEELRSRAKPALAELTREMAKQTVLGVDDALVELKIVDPQLRRSILSGLYGGIDQGMRMAEILAWILALLALVLALLLVRTFLRARKLSERMLAREREWMSAVQRARSSGHDEPWIAELVESIEGSAADR